MSHREMPHGFSCLLESVCVTLIVCAFNFWKCFGCDKTFTDIMNKTPPHIFENDLSPVSHLSSPGRRLRSFRPLRNIRKSGHCNGFVLSFNVPQKKIFSPKSHIVYLLIKKTDGLLLPQIKYCKLVKHI